MAGRTYGIKNNVTGKISRSDEREALSPITAPGPKAKRWGFFDTRYWLRDSILATLVLLIVGGFLFQPIRIEGNSMLPAVENRECIFVNRLAYRLEPVRRDDIIVFRYPLDPSKYFIKRVIGLPGDWVSIKDGQVYINGKPLREPYVRKSELGDENVAPVHVPPGHYYVLGDHRAYSDDSREWGTLVRKLIYGKAVFAYWPLSQFGPLG